MLEYLVSVRDHIKLRLKLSVIHTIIKQWNLRLYIGCILQFELVTAVPNSKKLIYIEIQLLNQTKIKTYVNVRASICLPDGSLSRSDVRVLSLASIGRYGALTCKSNTREEKKCSSMQSLSRGYKNFQLIYW